MKFYILIIIQIMGTSCLGMKIQQQRKTHQSSVPFKHGSTLSISKRSFSSSPIITTSPYSFFSGESRQDPLIRFIKDSKKWPIKKWQSHWPSLVKLCAAADTYQLCQAWGELYPDFYQSKQEKDDGRIKFVEYHIIKQNNEFIHALSSTGSTLPLLFKPSNVLR